MSWWPFSSSGADAKAQTQTQLQPPSPAQAISQQAAPQALPTSPPPSQAPHDPDFYAAHPHLAPPSFSTQTPTSTPETTLQSTNDPSPSSSDEPLDPLLPRTMSCRSAFDSAFYCSSLGGHFNDIYRYGQLRSCSEHWNDFWFCMRVKNSYSGQDTKERIIQERYREKEDRVRSGPCSEDVWRVRGEGEGVVGAFGMVENGGGK